MAMSSWQSYNQAFLLPQWTSESLQDTLCVFWCIRQPCKMDNVGVSLFILHNIYICTYIYIIHVNRHVCLHVCGHVCGLGHMEDRVWCHCVCDFLHPSPLSLIRKVSHHSSMFHSPSLNSAVACSKNPSSPHLSNVDSAVKQPCLPEISVGAGSLVPSPHS